MNRLLILATVMAGLIPATMAPVSAAAAHHGLFTFSFYACHQDGRLGQPPPRRQSEL
jgi:hypothetical protein